MATMTKKAKALPPDKPAPEPMPEPPKEPESNDIDARMASLLQDHIRMGARPASSV